MEANFDFLDLNFFTRATVFPGSIGAFRYRFQRTGWMNDGTIQAWVYENICFEQAEQIETSVFDWSDEGIEALKKWLLERFAERGGEPYRIPYPAPKNENVLE